MRTKKNKNFKKKTLKNRITNYICKKRDICCTEDFDRTKVIEQIFDLYEKIAEFYGEKDNYLDYVDNDVVKFIGYKIDLERDKDVEGVKLFNIISSRTSKNKITSKEGIINFLNEVPLYFLLSCLGSAYYSYTVIKETIENSKN